MERLYLKPIEEDDVKLIENWLNKDYILKWFSNAEEWLREIRARHGTFKFITHMLVILGDKPIGFCQYYPCSAVKEDCYGDTSVDGAYSMDYLIGEEDCLGKGLGKEVVRKLTETIFALEDSKKIMLKPEADNKPSCNALKANGYLYNEVLDFYFKEKF